MPKQKITKEMISDVAFEYARENGIENIRVKIISDLIGCSVQPIYSYYEDLDDLKDEVVRKTKEYLNEYLRKHIDPSNMFKSVGMAHARFARDEPNLYRLYFLRKRENIFSINDIFESETNPEVAKSISKNLNISLKQAQELHLNMMIYNVGISFILTTLGENIDLEEVSQLLDQMQNKFIKGEA